MRVSRRLVAALAVTGAVAVIPSSAIADDPCAGTVTDVGGAAYVVDRGDGGVWIYQESNGSAGLQAGGLSTLGEADPCQGDVAPDTLLF